MGYTKVCRKFIRELSERYNFDFVINKANPIKSVMDNFDKIPWTDISIDDEYIKLIKELKIAYGITCNQCKSQIIFFSKIKGITSDKIENITYGVYKIQGTEEYIYCNCALDRTIRI